MRFREEATSAQSPGNYVLKLLNQPVIFSYTEQGCLSVAMYCYVHVPKAGQDGDEKDCGPGWGKIRNLRGGKFKIIGIND